MNLLRNGLLMRKPGYRWRTRTNRRIRIPMRFPAEFITPSKALSSIVVRSAMFLLSLISLISDYPDVRPIHNSQFAVWAFRPVAHELPKRARATLKPPDAPQ